MIVYLEGIIPTVRGLICKDGGLGVGSPQAAGFLGKRGDRGGGKGGSIGKEWGSGRIVSLFIGRHIGFDNLMIS